MGQLSRNEIGAIQALAQHQVGRRETARLLDVDESTVRVSGSLRAFFKLERKRFPEGVLQA